ncbi:MAG TPA: RNA methyltransferase PUA domain-containing protein, partial [Pseudolysinimonas sp.]|nr:RNA methyltransferase PUA domain-containing protein [Pseudolysinimonas sp.]
MASLYLAPELRGADVVAGSVVRVTGDEARHAITVARVRVGERISVSDGGGLLATGLVSSTEGGVVTVEVESVARHPAPVP